MEMPNEKSDMDVWSWGKKLESVINLRELLAIK